MLKRYGQVVFLALISIFISPNPQAAAQNKNKIGITTVRGDFTTPTRLARAGEIPRFVDDLELDWMELAIQRQLKRYARQNLQGIIRYGQDKYPLSQIKESLEYFLFLTKNYKACLESFQWKVCRENLHNQIVREFKIYVPDLSPKDPRYGKWENTFFTGYYTPLIQVAHRQTAQFPHAIYRKPPKGPLSRATRVEIDFDHVLKGTNLELFYAQNLFDLYIMQVEGGGRAEVDVDGNGIKESYYLSYDGTNRQAFRFISKYMRKKGYIKNSSNASQRQFLKENPNKQREIYSSCPSYVFFKITDTPPLGSDGVPLTDNRSIATDHTLYSFKGGLSFIASVRPEENQSASAEIYRTLNYKPYSRFVLDQDTGGAIKGKARVDVYWGEGKYASLAAHNLFHNGRIWFLIKN